MPRATESTSGLSQALQSFRKVLSELRRELFGRYHPERYYMRGSASSEKTNKRSASQD